MCAAPAQQPRLGFGLRLSLTSGACLFQIPVENARAGRDEEEDPTFCEVCGRSDREDRLLLCDGCDAG